ncbi:sensor histidine kinase [Cyanobium sp. ATX 6F1]|uniref:sensor histidine kinase n=1 Tax=Cyanobium sp. ATX 6F1 TaxID=2823702 RepID=UPI0020CC23D9|nr:HAMP domain-containing sensor histidine kinase [Cyanobium sp. ATX 6F1]MCP9915175.1 HAMP domain-containing histidine kinase [Cyanobium sp. ATX 6F1]
MEKHPLSLRRRLLTTTLLAVLAGYGLLLVVQRAISSQARVQAHEQSVALVRTELLNRRSPLEGAAGLQQLLGQILTPGLLVWVGLEEGKTYKLPSPNESFSLPGSLVKLVSRADAAAESRSIPQEFELGGKVYVTSSQPIQLEGRPAQLRFLEDFSASAQQERRAQLLLIAAAGLATLFTSLLLRPVIRSGLRPLEILSDRLEGVSSESLTRQHIPVERQPAELAPIALAFNDLLDRLSLSFERQRSFVNGVSHELRTPITLIGGYASRLRRGSVGLDGEQQEQIALIEAESRRMAHLVTDLLDLARSDAGKLQLEAKPIDPIACLGNVCDRLQRHAGSRLQLGPFTENEGCFALGDAKRLEQCLANLIENALKYAPASTPISLRLSATPEELLLHVIDQGPGVQAADRQLIFERFKRGSSAGDTAGSGIGLAVVDALMRGMGGAVFVVDAPGGGADFRLQLKRSAAPVPALGRA